jgi:hypothetical protein
MLLGSAAATASPPGASSGARDGVALRRVSFHVPQVGRLVGHLRVPSQAAGRAPAVVVSNPFTAAKDQAVVAGYAQGLAAAGFVTLAFDQGNFGESEGLPASTRTWRSACSTCRRRSPTSSARTAWSTPTASARSACPSAAGWPCA